MIEHRPFAQLGQTKTNWLHARHHFSFGHYRDKERDHWGALRVWNDDIIQPHSGFPPHPHDNMEIITYVQTGAISHKDSLGNVGRIKAGDVQVMSAGSGIVHAEYNKENEPTQLFQIWIMPNQRDQPPSWGTQTFPKKQYVQQLIVLASGYETDSQALPIRAQARVLGGRIKAGKKISYEFTHRQRYGYLVSAKGQINVNGIRLQPRDGAAIHEEESIQIEAITDADIVLVDAPTLSG